MTGPGAATGAAAGVCHGNWNSGELGGAAAARSGGASAGVASARGAGGRGAAGGGGAGLAGGAAGLTGANEPSGCCVTTSCGGGGGGGGGAGAAGAAGAAGRGGCTVPRVSSGATPAGGLSRR